VLAAGGDFITRLSWGSVKLYDAAGARIDVTALLADASQTCEVAVWVKGISRAFRLVIQPLPAEAAERQRARRMRKANRNGHTLNPRTVQAAVFLLCCPRWRRRHSPPSGSSRSIVAAGRWRS